MKVTVRYFALMRDARGLAAEEVEGAFATAGALWDALEARHRFGVDRADLRVAINRAYAPFSAPLSDGDEVAFIPPVSGG